MSETLYATFSDASLAEKAVGALLDQGAREEDISVISKDRGDNSTQNATIETQGDHHTENATNGDHAEQAGKHGLSTTTPEDAKAGAAKGAGIGLGLGVAVAIASLIVPGFGLVIGGGALATAIAGAAGATAAGAVAGGVTGYLRDQGVPDEVAKDYHLSYENGSAMLSVHVPSGKLSAIEVTNLLSKYQATNVNTYGAAAQI